MELGWLIIAMAAFLGSHFILSHPLRAPLVRTLGLPTFLAFYSIVALATFGWVVLAFDRVPEGPGLWNGMALVPWLLASVMTLVALALFFASLVGNPALPGAKVHGLSAVLPRGVLRITRHPMMMAFAIWAVSHMLVAPTARTFVLTGGLLVLALVGSHLQDRKKKALYGTEWRSWMKRTSFWPDLAHAGELRIYLAAAFLPWLAITWLHIPLAMVPAGVWQFVAEHAR